MKTKSIALGTIATLIAVGGAFASSSLVSGRYAHIPEFPGGQKCRDIADVNCGVESLLPCKITLPGSGFTSMYDVYEDSACTDQVGNTHGSGASIPTTLQ